jgi:hypothetical protein
MSHQTDYLALYTLSNGVVICNQILRIYEGYQKLVIAYIFFLHSSKMMTIW